MQVLSDLLYGAVLAGVVLLLIVSLKLRGEQTSIDATQYRAAKIGMLSLVETMERDFSNIGSQLPPLTLKPQDAFVAFDTLGVPARLIFWAQTDSLLPAQQVCYTWQQVAGKTVQLKSGPVPLLEVERRTGANVGPDCSAGVLSGRSMNMVTRFEIDLLRADSLKALNHYGAAADIQQVLVRLRAVSPLGPGSAIEETRWQKIFRPANLWKPRDPT